MKWGRAVVTFGLLWAVALYAIAPLEVASAYCSPTAYDASTMTIPPSASNCGYTEWELQAVFAGQVWDEGPADAQGVCTGGWYNCDCALTAQSYTRPTKTFHPEQFDDGGGEYEEDWYWNIQVYDQAPVYTLCTPSDGPCYGDAPNGGSYTRKESDPYNHYDSGYDSVIFSCVQ